MKFLKHFTKAGKFIQHENDRNRASLKYLRQLGYPMPRIRKALIDLNGLKVSHVANADIAQANLMRLTLAGTRSNQQAREVLSGQLNLTVEEMFPDNQ